MLSLQVWTLVTDSDWSWIIMVLPRMNSELCLRKSHAAARNCGVRSQCQRGWRCRDRTSRSSSRLCRTGIYPSWFPADTVDERRIRWNRRHTTSRPRSTSRRSNRHLQNRAATVSRRGRGQCWLVILILGHGKRRCRERDDVVGCIGHPPATHMASWLRKKKYNFWGTVYISEHE